MNSLALRACRRFLMLSSYCGLLWCFDGGEKLWVFYEAFVDGFS